MRRCRWRPLYGYDRERLDDATTLYDTTRDDATHDATHDALPTPTTIHASNVEWNAEQRSSAPYVCGKTMEHERFKCPITGIKHVVPGVKPSIVDKPFLPNDPSGICYYASWQTAKNALGKDERGDNQWVWPCSENKNAFDKAKQKNEAVNFDELCKQDGITCLKNKCFGSMVRFGQLVKHGGSVLTEEEDRFVTVLEQSNGTPLHQVLTFFAFVFFATPTYWDVVIKLLAQLDHIEGSPRVRLMVFHQKVVAFKKEFNRKRDDIMCPAHAMSDHCRVAILINKGFWVTIHTSQTVTKEALEDQVIALCGSKKAWAHNLRLQEDPEFEQICKGFERDHEDLYKIFVRPFLTLKPSL